MRAPLGEVVVTLRPQFPDVADKLADAGEDVLAFSAFPSSGRCPGVRPLCRKVWKRRSSRSRATRPLCQTGRSFLVTLVDDRHREIVMHFRMVGMSVDPISEALGG